MNIVQIMCYDCFEVKDFQTMNGKFKNLINKLFKLRKINLFTIKFSIRIYKFSLL